MDPPERRTGLLLLQRRVPAAGRAAATSMRRSRTGRVLIAMRENERTAQSFGVNLVRTRLATFALSGFLAAFAGVLLVVHEHRLAPSSFGPEESIQIFLMAVIGGGGVCGRRLARAPAPGARGPARV